jgi:hypothetical protein
MPRSIPTTRKQKPAGSDLPRSRSDRNTNYYLAASTWYYGLDSGRCSVPLSAADVAEAEARLRSQMARQYGDPDTDADRVTDKFYITFGGDSLRFERLTFQPLTREEYLALQPKPRSVTPAQ